MRRPAPALAVAVAVALAGCAPERGDPLAPPGGAAPPPAATAPGPALAAVADVPHIYMALQNDAAGPTSVVLAIDASRDGTPSDDPAIRITPDSGACNPQQLRWYNFPPDRAQRPIYGPAEAARGVTARQLPDYMAQAVTSEMLAAGLIDDPEQSQPQNVCTRKLLQRIIIDRSTGQG
jgi:hypothetical protein